MIVALLRDPYRRSVAVAGALVVAGFAAIERSDTAPRPRQLATK